MKTFEVGIQQVYVMYITVEAEDAHSARSMANKIYWEEEFSDPGDYDHTLDWNEWPVWVKETGDLAE